MIFKKSQPDKKSQLRHNNYTEQSICARHTQEAQTKQLT